MKKYFALILLLLSASNCFATEDKTVSIYLVNSSPNFAIATYVLKTYNSSEQREYYSEDYKSQLILPNQTIELTAKRNSDLTNITDLDFYIKEIDYFDINSNCISKKVFYEDSNFLSDQDKCMSYYRTKKIDSNLKNAVTITFDGSIAICKNDGQVAINKN